MHAFRAAKKLHGYTQRTLARAGGWKTVPFLELDEAKAA